MAAKATIVSRRAGRDQRLKQGVKPGHEPGRHRADRHAVGDAAQSSAGSGSDTVQSSDWMAERVQGRDRPPDDDRGVVIDTGGKAELNRGQAKESRRGQR